MRQLSPNETACPGDWFYYFGPGEWIQIDERPAPIKRMTIREAEESNKHPHFPIVIMRPNWLETLLGTPPKVKPNQHQIRKKMRVQK